MASFGATCLKAFRLGRRFMAPATRWYFRKWAKNDTWLLIANELTMEHRLKVDKNPLPTVAIIDSQSEWPGSPVWMDCGAGPHRRSAVFLPFNYAWSFYKKALIHYVISFWVKEVVFEQC